MGRTVADVAMFLGAMLDAPISPLPSSRSPRAAFSPDLGDLPLDPAVRSAIHQAAEALADAGWEILEACPDLTGVDPCFEEIRGFSAALRNAALVDDVRLKATVRYEVNLGLSLSADRLESAFAAERRLRDSWDDFFAGQRFDLLLSATSQVPPFPVGDEWVREIDGTIVEHYTHWMRSCSRLTVPGGPSMSLPAGFTESGLPIGIQMSGQRNGDQDLLAFAAAAAEIFGPFPSPDLGALSTTDPTTLPSGPLG